MVSIYLSGTMTLDTEPVYADGSSSTQLGNPFVTATGVIGFYLAAPERVDLGIQPPGEAQVVFPDIDVSESGASSITLTFPGGGTSSTQVGASASAAGNNATALGVSAVASGISDTALGEASAASGGSSLAVGQGAAAQAFQSTVVGQGASAGISATQGVAVGQGATTSAGNAVAVGSGASSAFAHSTALGPGAVATAAGQVMLGTASDTVVIPGALLSPSGTTDWLNVRAPAFGAVGNGVADDTMAIQNAINAAALLGTGGGTVYLPAGNYKVNLAALVPQPGVRVTGAGRLATQIISTANSIFNMGGATLIDGFEIDHVTLQVTGFDLFTGVNVARLGVHDCQLIQNSAGQSIWNATTSGSQVMLECRFERNSEYVYGATRTVEAWFLSSASGSTQINQNVWKDTVCFNQNSDASRYWYHIQNTGSNNAANSFQNIVFEHCYGGMIWLESHTRAQIEQCFAWDVASAGGTISNHLIKITKNAGGLASSRNTIINSPRNQSGVTFAASTGDISLDASCVQTTIISPAASGDLALYLGGSTGVKIINTGSGSGNVVKDSATTAVAGAGTGTSPPSPVVTAGPTNESGTVTFGTGTTPSAGNQAVVTFGNPFSVVPTIIISPVNVASAALALAGVSPSASGFTVASGNAPSASQSNVTYGFRWFAIA